MKVCVLIPINAGSDIENLSGCLSSLSKQTIPVDVYISIYFKQLCWKPIFLSIIAKFEIIFDSLDKELRYIEFDYPKTILEHLHALRENISNLADYDLLMFSRYYDRFKSTRVETHINMMLMPQETAEIASGCFEKSKIDNYDDIDYVYYSIIPQVFFNFFKALTKNKTLYTDFKKLKKSHLIFRFYLARSENNYSYNYYQNKDDPNKEVMVEYFGIGSKLKDEKKLDKERKMIKKLKNNKHSHSLLDPVLNARAIKFINEKLSEACILGLTDPFKDTQRIMDCFTVEQIKNIMPNYDVMKNYCRSVYKRL